MLAQTLMPKERFQVTIDADQLRREASYRIGPRMRSDNGDEVEEFEQDGKSAKELKEQGQRVAEGDAGET
jgi:hypothetical protein